MLWIVHRIPHYDFIPQSSYQYRMQLVLNCANCITIAESLYATQNTIPMTTSQQLAFMMKTKTCFFFGFRNTSSFWFSCAIGIGLYAYN